MNNPFITEYPGYLPGANNNNNSRTVINHNEPNNRSVRAVAAPRRRGIRFNETVRSRAFNAANAAAAVASQRPVFSKLNGTKNSRTIRAIPPGNARRNNVWLAQSAKMKANAARSFINRPRPSRTMTNAHRAGLDHAAAMAPPLFGNEANNENNAPTCSGFGCFTRMFKKGRRYTRRH